jgi:hypothetical protein
MGAEPDLKLMASLLVVARVAAAKTIFEGIKHFVEFLSKVNR